MTKKRKHDCPQWRLITSFALSFFVAQYASAQTVKEQEQHQTYALLIGVTKYPHMLTNSLSGPANDVLLMANTLKPFNARVTILSEAGGEELYPTYGNIEREFNRLTAEVQPGDQVVILLAGHGSQNINNNPESDPETDGLDEIFLPRDTIKEAGKYVNVVSDDQLGIWLTRLRNDGASVLFISDSCHSDTQTRGDTASAEAGMTTRGLELLGDVESISRGERSREEAGESELDLLEESGSLIAFFAAQGKEETPDKFLAPGADKKESMGLLTYTVCKILKSYPGITYRELGQRIQQQYDLYRHTGIGVMQVPHPASCGIDLDRVVLGNQWRLRRSRFVFKVKGDIEISGGAIDGFTKGSILKLLPLAGEGEETLGWVVVDKVNARNSRSSWIDYDPSTSKWTKRTTPPASLETGRCEIESIQYAGKKLAIYLDPTFHEHLGEDLKQGYEKLVAELKSESKKDSMPFELVEVSKAEFLLGVSPKQNLSHDQIGQLMLRTRFNGTSFTPAAVYHFGPVDDNAIKRVISNFQHISRAKRLVNLALESSGNHASASGGIRFTLTAEIADQNGSNFHEVDLDSEEIPVGKKIRFRVRNYSPTTIKVTLLYVGDDFLITALLPSANDEVDEISPMKNGKPGEKIVDVGAELKVASRMRESLIAIATRKESLNANSNYTYLEQPPLNASWMGRNRNPHVHGWEESGRARGAKSPLEYLAEIGFNPSQARSMVVGSLPDHAFSVLTFTAVEPTPKPPAYDLSKTTYKIARGPWRPEVAESASHGIGKTVFPKVAPAVVVIKTNDGHGSGFMISNDGWLITNHHVVENVEADPKTGLRQARIYIGNLNSSGFMNLQDDPFVADVYKWDKSRDLALLKIRDQPEAKKFRFLHFATSTVGTGSECIAVGHPAAGSLWQLRLGKIQGASVWPSGQIDALMYRLGVSNPERTAFAKHLSTQPKTRVLISSCGCNPGDSGGPLVNQDGEVIAVTFATPLIDVEREGSLDEFSYHIELAELRNFIADKPDAPLLAPPELWRATDEYKLTSLSNHKTPDTLVLIKQGKQKEFVLAIDLDRDTPSAAYRDAESGDEIMRVWDFEYAFSSSERDKFVSCHYDSDNDGEIDMVLQAFLDGNTEMDIQWIREKATGTWKRIELVDSKVTRAYYEPLRKKFGDKVEIVFKQCMESISSMSR